LSFVAGKSFNIANNIQISGDPVFTPPSNTTQTISGVLSDGSSDGVVEMKGQGTLVLSGANTYSGGTTISSGILQVGIDTAYIGGNPSNGIASSAIGTGTLTFDGGTLQAGGSFTIANAGTINNTGGTIDSNGNIFTYAGLIGGTGGLTITD